MCAYKPDVLFILQLLELMNGPVVCVFCGSAEKGLQGIQDHCLATHGLTMERVPKMFACRFCGEIHNKETAMKHLHEKHPESSNMGLFHAFKLCLKEKVEISSKEKAENLKRCSVRINKAPPGFTVEVNPERRFEDDDWLNLSSD